jgi:hypothetical protein
MSNRSLAAARNRRSPQEVVSNTSAKKAQSQMPPQKMPPSPPQSSLSSSSSSKEFNPSQPGGKLSVSDVVGLITIRLSKLEAHMLKEQHDHQSIPTSTAGGVTDVDTVLRSLVSRISGLEKSTEDVQDHLGDLDAAVKERLDDLNNAVKDLEENPERSESVSSQPDPVLLERLEKMEKEVSELKQLVIRLQTMLIETAMAAKMAPAPVPVPLYVPPPSPIAPIEDTPGSMSLSI